jgi:hypothetical protein
MGWFDEEDDDSTKVNKYIKGKYADQLPATGNPLTDFSDEKRQAAMADSEERQSGLGWAQFAAGMGDALAGRSSDQTAKNFDGIRKGIKDNTVGEFDKRKDSAIKNIAFKKSADAVDPNSQSSLAFRKAMESNFPKIAQQYGDQWQHVTADDQESIFKPLQLRETIEARKEQARILAGDRAESRAQRNQDKQDKLDEKGELLQTSYGKARTPDDAKQIKEAAVLKKSFDNKIDELIRLREENGGEILNRQAVERGKQLSKDLLLDYKSLSGLGVLSQSDMSILNSIIPDDPLQYRGPLEVMQGQDSTLSKMKSFKSDKNKDFENRLAERLRNPGAAAQVHADAQPQQQKAIVKTQTNQKTGEKRIVYSDGSVEVVSNMAGGR